VSTDLLLTLVAGFGGGVLLLPVFTALFGLRFAVPMLTPSCPATAPGSGLTAGICAGR
jgi:uncharacterized membrane protein YfcA